MPSALAKFTKVKFTQNIIALRYTEQNHPQDQASNKAKKAGVLHEEAQYNLTAIIYMP